MSHALKWHLISRGVYGVYVESGTWREVDDVFTFVDGVLGEKANGNPPSIRNANISVRVRPSKLCL